MWGDWEEDPGRGVKKKKPPKLLSGSSKKWFLDG
jgi:hypothetical protein